MEIMFGSKGSKKKTAAINEAGLGWEERQGPVGTYYLEKKIRRRSEQSTEHGRRAGTEYLCASGVVGKDSPTRPWCNVFVTGRRSIKVTFRHSANWHLTDAEA